MDKYFNITIIPSKKQQIIKQQSTKLLNNKKNKITNNEIIKVYTDGACKNNGKKNAKAAIGVYFSENDNRNTSERITGKQSNNTAELKAIIKACNILQDEIINKYSIYIYTDSKYSILCATTYGKKQSNKYWCDNIPNKELVQELFNIINNNSNIELKYIKAHTNKNDIDSIGNKNADKLATNALH